MLCEHVTSIFFSFVNSESQSLLVWSSLLIQSQFRFDFLLLLNVIVFVKVHDSYNKQSCLILKVFPWVIRETGMVPVLIQTTGNETYIADMKSISSFVYLIFAYAFRYVCVMCVVIYSTKSMRNDGGYDVIMKAIENLGLRHKDHISAYGEGNELRLTGRHETADINTFKWVS